MKAKIRGTEIFFDVAGMQIEPRKNELIQKPVLFLIHGGPGGNHIHFKYDSIALANDAQLVFIDQRGCGWSRKAKQSTYTLQHNIEDIEALRNYLGLEKICVLGVSYGGMVAQGYAIKYGKNVEKLILAVTGSNHHFIEEARNHLQQIGTKKQIAVCEKYLWHGKFKNENQVNEYFKTMDSLYIQSGKKRKNLSSKHVKLGELKNYLSYNVLNAGFNGFLHRFNFTPHLKKITCPTLILAGAKDWIFSLDQARIMKREIPNARLEIFNKAGHSIARDQPKKYIQTIRAFLKS